MWDGTAERLREAGYKVETEFWPQVVERFKTGKYNVVILDNWYDDFCKEHAAEIKKLDPNCKVLVDVDRRGQSGNDPHFDGEISVSAPLSEIIDTIRSTTLK